MKGNADDGASCYATCAACHGADGQGVAATNAPRLKGMSDWYMATQLKNFKTGCAAPIRRTSTARRWR